MFDITNYYVTKLANRLETVNRNYHAVNTTTSFGKIDVDQLLSQVIPNELGHGAYGSAHSYCGCPLVIKLVKPANRKKHGEDGYISFAKWCMTQNSKHLPKIYKIISVGDHKAVIMKRYKEIRYDSNQRHKAVDIYECIKQDHRIDEYGEGHHNFEKLTLQVGEMLKNTVFSIFTVFSGKWCMDLHTGNMMQDEDGNIVITDPIAGRKQHTFPPKQLYVDNLKKSHIAKEAKVLLGGKPIVGFADHDDHIEALRHLPRVPPRPNGLLVHWHHPVVREVNAGILVDKGVI